MLDPAACESLALACGMERRNCRRCGRVFDGTPYTTTTYDAAAFLCNPGGGGQTPITVRPQGCEECLKRAGKRRRAGTRTTLGLHRHHHRSHLLCVARDCRALAAGRGFPVTPSAN